MQNRITKFPEYPLSEEETNQVEQEGWCLSLMSCNLGDYYQLQKLDESDIFETDQEAWDFVFTALARLDSLSLKVLIFLKEHSPLEWKEIALTRAGASKEDIEKSLLSLRDKIVAEELVMSTTGGN